jgi:glutathione S-transferase
MSAIILHGFHRSTYVTIAKLVLAAKGVEYLFHDTETAMVKPDGWTLHPFDRVPVLEHGDFTVWETAAIAAYVDDAFCGPALAPANAQQRARMNQWISAVNSYYYPWIIQHLILERVVFPELGLAADETAVLAALPRIRQGLHVLERFLGNGFAFLAGERASLADYFMFPMLTALGLANEGRQALSNAPATIAWIARMAIRPEVVLVGSDMPPRTPVEHARRWDRRNSTSALT